MSYYKEILRELTKIHIEKTISKGWRLELITRNIVFIVNTLEKCVRD